MEFLSVSQSESESFDAAIKSVAEKLTKPEQLENLDQMKRKIARKKAAVESQLRNAVQTQLDGVQTGLAKLEESKKVIQEVKEGMNQVEQLYQQCADLTDVIGPIREVSRKYQQLKTTSAHIKNIFNVPEKVKLAHEMIEEGRLLEAHRSLIELEHTRDQLLMQLYQSEDTFVDKNTSLHHYFEPLVSLSDSLGQCLWMKFDQLAQVVSEDCTSMVTAVRIIEREEKMDKAVAKMLEDKNIPVSQLPGRPKHWKQKCFELLESSVSNKFTELKPEDRMESKSWLSDYLNAIAGLCFQGLSAVKNNGQKCFPPNYNILDACVKCYHDNLVIVISDLVKEDLNARDIISLMIWVGDVRASFQEALDVDLTDPGPLIDPSIEENLQVTCLKQVDGNIRSFVVKMLENERDEWDNTNVPEVDVERAFYTTVGITLFQMMEQNTSALSPLGIKTKLKVFDIALQSIQLFQAGTRENLKDYYEKHLECNRREPPFFIHYVIAAANNCKSCIEFLNQQKEQFLLELGEKMMDVKFEKQIKAINEEFDSISHFCCDILVDVVFMDLRPVLQRLLTKESWFQAPHDLIGKVEGTILDYNEDFSHLKKALHSYVIVECQQRLLKAYLDAFMNKRMVLKKEKERETATQLILEETRKISSLFLRLSHATNPKHIQILEQFAELLRAKNEFLTLEVASLVSRHPAIKSNHIIAVLSMRGDLKRSDVMKLMQQTPLTEDTDGGKLDSASGSSRGGAKKEDVKDFLSGISVPNPYALFGK